MNEDILAGDYVVTNGEVYLVFSVLPVGYELLRKYGCISKHLVKKLLIGDKVELLKEYYCVYDNLDTDRAGVSKLNKGDILEIATIKGNIYVRYPDFRNNRIYRITHLNVLRVNKYQSCTCGIVTLNSIGCQCGIIVG